VIVPYDAQRPPLAHRHEWRLLEVEFEDGHTTRVFGCHGCGQEQLRL